MKVTLRKDGVYEVDGQPIDDLAQRRGAVKALKKPIPITACQVTVPFTVETSEGEMTGQPLDWLMQGVTGEMYICPNDVFVKSYDVLPSSEESGA